MHGRTSTDLGFSVYKRGRTANLRQPWVLDFNACIILNNALHVR